MTRFAFGVSAAAVAIAVAASQSAAQGTTQQTGVVGQSGVQTYTLQVTGADGQTYNCRPNIQNINGTPTRFCRRANIGAQGLQTGSLTAPSVAGAVVAGAVVLSIIADGGSGTTTTTSDRRLKTDIVRVGTTAHGLPLYHFRYVGGETTWEGVMAQDVLEVMPDAVVTQDSGALAVNYEMLGLEMRHVDQAGALASQVPSRCQLASTAP